VYKISPDVHKLKLKDISFQKFSSGSTFPLAI